MVGQGWGLRKRSLHQGVEDQEGRSRRRERTPPLLRTLQVKLAGVCVWRVWEVRPGWGGGGSDVRCGGVGVVLGVYRKYLKKPSPRIYTQQIFPRVVRFPSVHTGGQCQLVGLFRDALLRSDWNTRYTALPSVQHDVMGGEIFGAAPIKVALVWAWGVGAGRGP